MAETYGPFDGGPGASLGEDFFFDTMGPLLQRDGVDSDPNGTGLQVYANSSGMQVFVQAGKAVLRGSTYANTADIALTIAGNSSGSARVDRVVLRHDRVANTIHPIVVQGTPGGGAPALTQTVGGVWDLPLGQVTVDAGQTTTVAGNKVTDDRRFRPLDRIVCTSNSRPTNQRLGQEIFESDTGYERYWTGSAWKTKPTKDTGWLNVTPLALFDVGHVWARRIGDQVDVDGFVVRTGPNIAAQQQASEIIQLPAACGGPKEPRGWISFVNRDTTNFVVGLTLSAAGKLSLFFNSAQINTNDVMYVSTSFFAA